ncbi:MAG: YopX family protein [bacterium]|nr:YopX family protein [bacterium]
MREIKFRGKDMSTGAWVYGGFHKHQTMTPSPVNLGNPEKLEYVHLIIESGFSDWNMPKPILAHAVDPETVGEYTGLHDRKGKEIFEGDIVVSKQHDPKTFQVSFIDGGFCGAHPKTNEWLADLYHFYPSPGCCIEIIGNTHDNAEKEIIAEQKEVSTDG